jgi:signal transduction histidine kinase
MTMGDRTEARWGGAAGEGQISRWSSLKTKVSGLVVALVLLLGLAVILQTRYLMIPALEHQLQLHAIAMGRDLAARSADVVLTNNLFGLHQLAVEMREHSEDMEYAFIVDPAGMLVVHSFVEGFPPALLTANYADPEQRYNLRTFRSEVGVVHDVAVPIAGGIAGTARVGMSDRRLRQAVIQLVRRELAFTALVSLLGIATGFVYLNGVLVRPLSRLVRTTTAIADGDLATTFPDGPDDEIGELARAFNVMTGHLRRSSRELKAKEEMRLKLLSRVLTAQEEERRRISRELHDETGQYLTSLMLGLKTIEDAQSMEVTRKTAAALREMSEGAFEAVHSLSLELRPGLLDDIGLVAALRKHAADYERRTGIGVDFSVAGLDDQLRLTPDMELTLYRIVQEALTNVARHSGAAQARVLLCRDEQSVTAIVEDDGKGFDLLELARSETRHGRLGLFGMEERASLIGGRFTVESSPGAGTTIVVRVPLATTASGGV